MRDGIGSVVMIVIIITFIVFASSFLAFNVNYTKAFRMKNKIISLYEDYKGDCTTECVQKIEDYADGLGYQPATLNCGHNYTAKPAGRPLYCERKVDVDRRYDPDHPDVVVDDKIGTHYYKIVTRINIEIPIFDNIMGPKFLYVNGDTKLF